MDLFKQGMKGPTRQAPPVPGTGVNRYSPVTNWNDDPFDSDLFEPTPQFAQKKKPPPRPPPPKVNSRQPDIPVKPSHFMRKPTVLTSLLSRKSKTTATNQSSHVINTNHNNLLMDGNCELDTSKMFPRCEPKNVQTGALIDLSSPPSSPTFTTRSSSDGLSVDSFSSDATTSTNHHNAFNNGNASQAESGFEDDFDLFLHSRKQMNKEDTLDDFKAVDPFSPPPASNKPPLLKKPTLSKDLFEVSCTPSVPVPTLSVGPTIIRAKPARPKPPDNSALLKSSIGSLPVTSMNLNTTTPIQKINNGFGDSFDSTPFSWDRESPEREDRESSPPMPTIPPPPPPPGAEDELAAWPDETDFASEDLPSDEEPYAIALFDYFTDHPEDLCFSANSKISLIRRVDDEWLYGRVRSGASGLFPANYVEVRVPLRHAGAGAAQAQARALYDLQPEQPGDLRLRAGDTVNVLSKLNDQWYFGECNGLRGQFPINYVQMS
ncbi:SH3 domain-containing protein 19 [Cydia amplana]|uniref:SH3 domain-containing protein 19 n=1 Tax=Cydia amplana TaxID=1869771 RepID=UPI002FE6742B